MALVTNEKSKKFMDLVWLLFQPPILKALAPYLNARDVFALSGLNKSTYFVWTQDKERCINVLDLRRLVKERFNWTYTCKNPFIMIRTAMLTARMPINGATTRFLCTGGCGKRCSVIQDLMSGRFCLYATCQHCFFMHHATNASKYPSLIWESTARDIYMEELSKKCPDLTFDRLYSFAASNFNRRNAANLLQYREYPTYYARANYDMYDRDTIPEVVERDAAEVKSWKKRPREEEKEED
jgi:hypothetical protein